MHLNREFFSRTTMMALSISVCRRYRQRLVPFICR
nr:MAG TPA: hypothetical protein [Caudoviricetes sp.]